MSLSAIITPAILDKVIGLLVPLLIDSAGGDLPTARHAAMSLLADYEPETEEELRLAAEIIGFGFGALDALSQSMAPDLTLNAILRLRGSANTQHRCANQCQRTLDKLRKERRLAEATVQLLAGEPASNDRTATADMDFAPPLASDDPSAPETLPLSPFAQAPLPNSPSGTLSRQQRRAAERKAKKVQKRQASLARLEAMQAMRAFPINLPAIAQQRAHQAFAA